MKKQTSSSIINLCEVPCSDAETEKAMPKIDKEELRKYLQNSDDESSQEQITPKRPKNVKRLKTPPIEGSPIIKPKKVISKDTPQNFLAQGDDFKKLQKTLHEKTPLHKIKCVVKSVLKATFGTPLITFDSRQR